MPGTPDFFIAGVAKCGTTALWQYLKGHPAIFLPERKEPYFFSTDLNIQGRVSTLEEYRELFASAPAHSVIGEASPLYTYSKVAVRHIMQHNPDSKIIVMLRYPVDAAYSLHTAAWNHGRESTASFEEAWRLQGARLAGDHIPTRWTEPATLQYGSIYRYAAQVRRVLEQVPQGQRHFVTYEDFFADPHYHYAKILEFLNLSVAIDGTFVFVNPNPAVRARSRWIDGLLRKPPGWLKSLYAPIRPVLRAAGLDPKKLRELNLVPRQKPALRPEFRAELDDYFAEDIIELERLLGRRLWARSGGLAQLASTSV